MLPAAAVPFDMMFVNPLGVSGWIVLGVVVVVLWLMGQFGREPQLAPANPKWTPPAAEPASEAAPPQEAAPAEENADPSSHKLEP